MPMPWWVWMLLGGTAITCLAVLGYFFVNERGAPKEVSRDEKQVACECANNDSQNENPRNTSAH